MTNNFNKVNLNRIIFNELQQHKEESNVIVKQGVVQAYGLLNIQAGKLVEFVDSIKVFDLMSIGFLNLLKIVIKKMSNQIDKKYYYVFCYMFYVV